VQIRPVDVVEHILRDVHWTMKAVQRREYSSELIETSAAGLHQDQSVLGPDYIQGAGRTAAGFP
jgi:hypothetical protein